MGPRTMIGVLVTALGLLAMPAGAAAKQDFDVQARSLRLAFSVPGSNGFHGLVTTRGHKQVTLTLSKGGVLTELRTSGRVSRHGISARFGDLAHVEVRFQADPRSPGPKSRRRGLRDSSERACHGRAPIQERGVFHGTISFRGEDDSVLVDARHAPGAVERRFRRICKRPPKGSFASVVKELLGKLRITLLEARARVDGANMTFEATAVDFGSILGPGTPLFYGFNGRTMERADGVRIVHAAKAEGNQGDGTLLPGRPSSASRVVEVAPSRPFLKAAKRLKEPDAPASWTGPLAMRLPEAGLVPLAGPGFKSALCSLTLDEFTEGHRCLKRRGEPEASPLAKMARAAIQGSGSQSQAFWDARLSWSR